MSLEKAKMYTAEFTHPPVKTPDPAVPDGPMCGNGDIGVTATASPGDGQVDFYLSKNDFWNGLAIDRAAGIRCYGFLRFHCPADFQEYSACQRLDTAELEVTLSGPDVKWRTTCVVLRKTNLIVHRLTAVRGNLSITPDLFHTHRDETAAVIEKKGAILYGRKEYDAEGCDWPCRAFSITKALDGSGLCLNLAEGQSAVLVTSLHTNQEEYYGKPRQGENPRSVGQTEDCRKLCEEELADLTSERLSALRDAHDEWWKGFWEESSVLVPGEPLAERFWYLSQYLMACCCESGKFPPGLFGSWITTDESAWNGDYHLNYNYQAPWWGLYSSNHIRLCDSYDQPLLDYMPKSEKAARDLLHCAGLYTVVGIGPKGLSTDPTYWGQKSNASYAALNMLMRFYSTYDRDYAVETAYPYLEKAADFWLDYLEWDGERYVILDDCIHESSVPAGGGDRNPLLSLGLIRALFRGLLDICEAFGLDSPKREKWRHVLEHISDFPTMERNGSTIFRLSEEGMAWNDGNSLGIQHIYPTGCIGLDSPARLRRIAEDTFAELDRWDDYNAFPTYFSAGVRLGVPSEEILRHLKEQLISHGMENGFVYYGGGGIECCSTVPMVLNEMLMQSHEGVIRLFPVWNPDRDASFRSLRAYGAFLVSASLKDGAMGDVEILSEKGRTCTVAFPGPVSAVVRDGAGTEIGRFEGTRFSFPTSAGEYYRISL